MPLPGYGADLPSRLAIGAGSLRPRASDDTDLVGPGQSGPLKIRSARFGQGHGGHLTATKNRRRTARRLPWLFHLSMRETRTVPA